jgi:hypothetical protein
VRPAVFGILAVALIAAGCTAAGHQQAVFGSTHPGPAGNFERGMVLTNRVYDIEQPRWHNFAYHPVQLTSVHLASPASRHVHVLSIRAYLRACTSLTAVIRTARNGSES